MCILLFIWLHQVLVAACEIFSLWHANSSVVACRVWFSDYGSNPCPLHWEYGVLASGPLSMFPYTAFQCCVICWTILLHYLFIKWIQSIKENWTQLSSWILIISPCFHQSTTFWIKQIIILCSRRLSRILGNEHINCSFLSRYNFP